MSSYLLLLSCTPDVVVTANGKTLVKDTDYRVTYFENIAAGDKTAYAVVQGSLALLS